MTKIENVSGDEDKIQHNVHAKNAKVCKICQKALYKFCKFEFLTYKIKLRGSLDNGYCICFVITL